MAQSYKIFIKDVLLLVSDDSSQLQQARRELGAEQVDWDIMTIITTAIRNPRHRGFLLYKENPTAYIEALKSSLKLVVSAGGIVWNKQKELLMIFRRGKWDLPKGKVEENESLETAALREVEEESGVGMLRLLEKFDISYHIYKENNLWVLKETHWYEMTSQDTGGVTPQKSEGITKVQWIPVPDMNGKLKKTYASMRNLIEQVLSQGYITT